MPATIQLHNLSKRYKQNLAVDDLSLSIEEGEIFGFVGPNGAGKTSTIRMIAGLLQPTSGEIYVQGHSVRFAPEQAKAIIGYMPDFFGTYPNLKVWEYLDFFGDCHKIPAAKRSGLIQELLELVELSHRSEDLVDQLSRGLQQRLSLARTLIHDPQVLILDEPASGLDPRARIEIRELLVELADMGKTIFFSTHILADVAEICTRVGIIEAGKLVATGSLDELQVRILPQREIEITLLDGTEAAQALLQTMHNISAIQTLPARENGERNRITLAFSGSDQDLSQVLKALVQHDIPVIQFREEDNDLEEVFLRATKGLVT
ncbi:MAG: ABC transporter ATP-binding protein [Chloroflexota bacterium]